METPSFTVLTVSKRGHWFYAAKQQIANQNSLPKEWVIIAEDIADTLGHKAAYPGDPWGGTINMAFEKKTPFTIYDAPKTNNPSNLNASLNAGLKLIDTDYVIFYQDFIELPVNCFQKLMNLAAPDTFVSTCTPKYDGSDDGRYLGVDQPRPCRPDEWETNVALAPMQMLRDLGGFDERLDVGWSWDNVNVALRAEMLGAKFIIDESNRPTLLPHEQTSKLTMTTNGELNNRLIKEIIDGKAPLKLPYL